MGAVAPSRRSSRPCGESGDRGDTLEEGEGTVPEGDRDGESTRGTCDPSVTRWERPAHPTKDVAIPAVEASMTQLQINAWSSSSRALSAIAASSPPDSKRPKSVDTLT